MMVWDWAIGAGFGGVVYGDFFPGFGFWIRVGSAIGVAICKRIFFFFGGGGLGGRGKKEKQFAEP